MSDPSPDLASEGDINFTPRRAAWQRTELDERTRSWLSNFCFSYTFYIV